MPNIKSYGDLMVSDSQNTRVAPFLGSGATALSVTMGACTSGTSTGAQVFNLSALSENLTKQPLLRNFLHPLNREELDVGHRHPLGLQQQIPQVLIAPAAVNQHTNVPVHR